MENKEQNTDEALGTNSNLNEVKNFYKYDFKVILVTVFKNPTHGIHSIFQKPSTKAQHTQSIMFYSSIFVFYLLGGYIIAGEARKYIDFGIFIKISLIPVVFMFLISVISFGIKSISGKPNFKAELLTGSLCGIPLGIIISLFIVMELFGSGDNIMRLVRNPDRAGIIGGLLLLYITLMLINILQQSLKASGIKDALAWYLSPVSILLAAYFTYEISKNIF